MKKIILILLLLLIVSVGIYLYLNQGHFFNNEIDAKTKENDNIEYNGIFKDYYKLAKKKVNKMSIEEKVGQLFLVRYEKKDTTYLNNFYPGGYILFAKDFNNHTKEEMKKELDDLQKISKYPLILGVDEEGGYVTRVSRYKEFRSEKFKSPRSYYEEGGYELLEKTENEKAILLKSIGLNLNLAPVADVSVNEEDFINNRTFGQDSEKTSEYIKKMVEYANNNNINSTLKHFPGYGNNEDTHTGIAIDNREYSNFEENDYKPFKAGIDAKVPSILVSIMTDDLAMDAVKEYVEDGKAATMAINAGNDMIITSDFMSMKKELLDAVKNNELSEEKINLSVTRVIAWKYYSGLIK